MPPLIFQEWQVQEQDIFRDQYVYVQIPLEWLMTELIQYLADRLKLQLRLYLLLNLPPLLHESVLFPVEARVYAFRFTNLLKNGE